jgi:hypothetical protein
MSISTLISQDTTYISLPDAFINQWYYNSDIDVNQYCNGCMCPTGEPMFETQIVSYPNWLDTAYISFFPDTSNYDYYYFGGLYQLIVTGTPLLEDIGNTNLILHEYISYDLWDGYYENATWDFTDVYIINLSVEEECADLSGISFPECGIEIGFGYIDGECQTMYCSPIDGYGVDWSNWIYNTIEECGEVCGTNNPITLGDINFDGDINVLDVVLLVSFILGDPTDEYEHMAADINGDSSIDVLDAVLLIEMILNPQLPNECYIVPEVGPCDGICPTYYYNQNTNECEEFITSCCGVEAFNTLQECQNTCGN